MRIPTRLQHAARAAALFCALLVPALAPSGRAEQTPDKVRSLAEAIESGLPERELDAFFRPDYTHLNLMYYNLDAEKKAVRIFQWRRDRLRDPRSPTLERPFREQFAAAIPWSAFESHGFRFLKIEGRWIMAHGSDAAEGSPEGASLAYYEGVQVKDEAIRAAFAIIGRERDERERARQLEAFGKKVGETGSPTFD